jgi:hypothetical protein
MIGYDNYIGIPYKYNGQSKAEGLDCWGLVQHIWAQVDGLNVDNESFYQLCPTHESLSVASVLSALNSNIGLIELPGLAPDCVICGYNHDSPKQVAVGYWTGEKIITSRPGRVSTYMSLVLWLRIFESNACFIININQISET